MIVIDLHGRDVGSFSADERARLGIAVPVEECGERRYTVTLDDSYSLVAVRAWYHGRDSVPRSYRIEVEPDGDAGVTRAFLTTDNTQARDPSWDDPIDHAQTSLPVTTEFRPVRARKVHLVLDTCSALPPEDLARYQRRDPSYEGRPGNAWLYELEVFARLSPYEAWRRRLFGP